MINKNILLISDNDLASKILAEKLVLLRIPDEISVLEFENVESALDNIDVGVVFVDEIGDKEKLLNTIRVLKLKKSACKIILLARSEIPDNILSLYDEGVDDFILPNTKAYEVLIKTVNAFKSSSQYQISDRNSYLLSHIGAYMKDYGFYTESYASELMHAELDKLKGEEASFIIVTYDELDRAKFDFKKLADAVKKTVRSTDVVIALKTGKFYILLKNSKVSGAEVVFSKLKKLVGADFRLKAGICAVGYKSFEELEQKTSTALTDAMLSANDTSVYTEKSSEISDDWNIDTDNKRKDFKLFKSMYLKKLEKVVAPLFFRMQNEYEDLLGDTKIEQYTDENQCIFYLKSAAQISRLTLVYTGFAKIVIYVTHGGLDSPENQNIIMPLKELSDEVLAEILEKFIKDYKSCIENK